MKKLIEVTLFTGDVQGTVRFYHNLLGLKPVWELKDSAQFDLNGVILLIHVKGDSEKPLLGYPPDRDHFAFGVEDVDKSCAELLLKGIKAEVGPKAFEWGRSAYFKDPGGRLVELHQV